MNKIQITFVIVFIFLILFSWAYYFWGEIKRRWRERGPRRQIAREAAREREAELARLRDELASKYLPPGVGTPPAREK